MQPVYTIGFQGKHIAEFIDDLKEHNIGLLVDVRRRAMSRKAGFSKNALEAGLNAAGIAYHHAAELGTPADLFAQRDMKANSEVITAFRDRISEFVPALEAVATFAETQRICLFCFELDHATCHRSVIADWLAEHRSAEIVNI